MNAKITIPAQKPGRSEQIVCLRQTNTLLTANYHFAYGKLTRTLLLTLLFLLTAVSGAWGQTTDYSGTYFIASNNGYNANNTANNYYWVPAADPQQANNEDAYYSANYNLTPGDPEKPFITTFMTGQNNNSIWQIESSGDGYYFFKHWLTGKYLIYKQVYNDKNSHRKAVHLETIVTPGDDAKFDIQESGSGVSIRPISLTTGNRFLNPAGGNQPRYNGGTSSPYYSGMIGVYNSATDGNSIWRLEETVTPPTFSVNADGDITITADAGTTIHYTTNGDTPTAGSTTYTGAITPTADMTTIKAIAVRTSDESKVSNAVSLPLQAYTFYIINRSGEVAVKYEVKQAVGKALRTVNDIPAAIRSPYLSGESAAFYSFSEAYTSANQLTDEVKITATPSADASIYVTYTTDHLIEKFLHLRGARAFNITSGGKCIYDNNGTLSTETNDYSTEVMTTTHLWKIAGNDPYAVEIQNFSTGNFLVSVSMPTFSLTGTATTKFILMEQSAATNADYETLSLMMATGTGDNNLTKAEARAYSVSISTTYHLIDRQGKLIVSLPSNDSELKLPDEWVSPLVSEYHYYKTANIDANGVYTLSNTITSPFDVDSGGNIYVNYDVSDAIDLDGRNSLGIVDKENITYMLRYLDGQSFQQEDGDDGVMDTERKAIYPYSNGDAALYVYGQERWKLQLESGASTRTRWLWYIEPANNPTTKEQLDPYHVKISSYQTQTNYKPADVVISNFHSYLRTYQPDGYDKIVTGVTNDNPRTTGGEDSAPANSSLATEYMILGQSLSQCRLTTLLPVAIDLNGDGDSADTGENERRTVNSFEMYWKNNPTVNGREAGSKPAISPVLTNPVTASGRNIHLTDAQKADITAKGWHVYEEWANSLPWVDNGDATASEPASTGKKYLKEEHVFQTIDMGTEGHFVFEEVSLAPQVILIDNHGWEIMRVPLAKTDVLKTYDSPMVEQYQWYATSSKEPGYHKYIVSGDPNHVSTSLGDVPSGSTDFYVTYTVKPHYANAYTGAATAEGTKASAYLLKQGGKYAMIEGSNIVEGGAPASMDDVHENIQWYLRPNFDIDHEMGYRYAGESGAQDGALSKAETELAYYNDGHNGFDPYNVQIQSVYNQTRYFTANTTSPALTTGTWTGTSSQVTLQNLSAKQTATGYDQTTLNITNATFMVVDDGNGNMRLMPRFDHTKVATISGSNPFASLAAQTTAATAGDTGTGSQTLWLELIPKATEIHSSSEIDDMNGHYLLAEDFTFESGFTSLGTEDAPFRGIIDGEYHTFSSPNTALVAYAEGAKIRNIFLDNVTISSGYNVGAICNEAHGDTRIYNCGVLATHSTVEVDDDGYTHITINSSTIRGSNYVGGIVGLLDGSARVINCFSYANITGGTNVGGIVGYNNQSTSSENNNQKTMVMNCMFYGDIKDCTTISPIYGGNIISNAGNNGVGNYNYFRLEAPYVQPTGITYNCALGAEDRFLQRFEFFRHLLNSHRELAAWWATDHYTDKDEMAKWVLLPSQIGTSTPYPVLAKPGYYPSVVNIDAENATTQTERNKGGLLGTLSVKIQMGNGGAVFDAPTGAEIVYPSLTLNITDKDPEHFNFNYAKVQLPYYNDVGTKNYTGNRVVTGWKIVSITGGTPGTFTASDSWGGYNFADRNCTNKDLYGTGGSNRIFNQGAYWDVPEGVTEITIEPYWARCVYLADPNADKVYNTAMETGYDVPRVGGGQIFNDGKKYNLATHSLDETNGQIVYTSMGNAIASSGSALFVGVDANSHSVYDYAVVLVGNYHHYNSIEASRSKPYTVTSIDLDGDNEPDYSYILRFNGRTEFHPVRADFINIPGLGMAQKSNGGTGSYNFGILIPKGWFESTNTSLFRFTQFEYEHSSRSETDALIVQGGVMEQWVSYNQKGRSNKIPYIHVGGNVWFKEFHTGCHQDKNQTSGNNRFQPTKHSPISVTGGDFDEFYLTGLYVANANLDNYADNAECYINGGRFGTVCGAAMEGIGKANGSDNTGNITWQIQNADIKEFYAGGLNAAKPVTGNLSTTIIDSHVNIFCGGPKFGDMSEGKTVTTNATGCTFGTFFGAGYGGNSYSRYAPSNQNNVTNINWNNWVNDQYKQEYNATYGGVSTQFFYQFLPMSDNKTNVARILIDFVKFSLATTHGVTSTLTRCTINNNFYGGGSLGKVDGSITSVLDSCTVKGNVFGAGFSASLPTVEVDNIGFRTEPYYYEQLGTYRTGVKGATTTYHWEQGKSIGIDKEKHILYTTETLGANLGSVSGAVTLTVTGNSVIGTEGDATTGNVYGGGDESYVTNDTTPANATTTVNISGNTLVYGDVFGGGNRGLVSGNTTVNIRESEPKPENP